METVITRFFHVLFVFIANVEIHSLQATPPLYDISAIDVPIAMFHGTNDWLVVPKEIYRLESETRNLVFQREIGTWEHLDFIWAMDATQNCYDDVIRLFKNQL